MGHYDRFIESDLILRDELAIDRTVLANERTLLAYVRTAITLLIAGVSIISFSPHEWFSGVGVACLPGGVIAGTIGILRYRRMDRAIAGVRNKLAVASAERKEPAGSRE